MSQVQFQRCLGPCPGGMPSVRGRGAGRRSVLILMVAAPMLSERKETKICNRICRKAYGRHVLRLKIRLARASGSRDFWKLTKHLSGMSKRKRTATPSSQALTDYFAAKMSLPREENKQVPPLEQLPDRRCQVAEKLQAHRCHGCEGGALLSE
mmetsp:Transcript_13742/g.21575  ORF Transcript_13742/g.21575 Transcript_13742/m.21575 type:complete len:153 (+) Transcript_13742:156-614(+)